MAQRDYYDVWNPNAPKGRMGPNGWEYTEPDPLEFSILDFVPGDFDNRTESGGWNGPLEGDAGFAPGEPDPNQPGPEAPAKPPKRSYTDDLGGMDYWVAGVDLGKYGNPQHNTGKYLLSRYQEDFNPAGGITQEFVDLLNADPAFKGAKFRTTGKDWLYVDDDPSGMFEGVKGADLIEDYGGKNQWHGWGGNYGTDEYFADQAGGSDRMGSLSDYLSNGQPTQSNAVDVQPIESELLQRQGGVTPVATELPQATTDELGESDLKALLRQQLARQRTARRR